MTEDRKLLVGVDLSNDFTQLSCYRRDIDKVIPAGRLVGRERDMNAQPFYPGSRSRKSGCLEQRH